MQIKVEKLSKVVFRGEAPCQCKLEINMNKVVDDSKGLDRTVLVVLGKVAGLGRCHETR